MGVLWIAIAAVVIGVVVLMTGFIVSRRERSLIEDRLGLGGDSVEQEVAPGVRKTPVGDALNSALTRRGVGSDLATQLARADLKVTVGEFMAATVILVIFAGGVAFFLRRDILITVGACLGGFFAPRIYVSVLRGRRLKAFNDQLGDTINLMVNGIRAGYSVLQAMEAVSQEMGPPISGEFGRVVREVQLGLTLENSLDNMLRRVPSDDLDMMITAINVQREVGGNLAEVLDSISHTIRERVRIKGELKAMTGQSRMSGYMIGALPVAIAIFLYIINPDYISQLFEHPCGYAMLGCAGVGIIGGFAVISKVMQIDV
ncbi:MAG: type II secretion system F family protein [Chloroflexota bacterium]|nr:type II secretion system F family protein [Chloroflexota bacterium]